MRPEMTDEQRRAMFARLASGKSRHRRHRKHHRRREERAPEQALGAVQQAIPLASLSTADQLFALLDHGKRKPAERKQTELSGMPTPGAEKWESLTDVAGRLGGKFIGESTVPPASDKAAVRARLLTGLVCLYTFPSIEAAQKMAAEANKRAYVENAEVFGGTQMEQVREQHIEETGSTLRTKEQQYWDNIRRWAHLNEEQWNSLSDEDQDSFEEAYAAERQEIEEGEVQEAEEAEEEAEEEVT